MTIKFVDPGYDWTVFIVIGIGAVGLLLAAGVFLLLHRFRSTGYSSYESISGWLLFSAILWSVFGGGMIGTMIGQTAYLNRVSVALYSALEDAGFDQISLDSGDKRGEQTLHATLDGKPFGGVLINLHYPKDFTYKILEVSK